MAISNAAWLQHYCIVVQADRISHDPLSAQKVSKSTAMTSERLFRDALTSFQGGKFVDAEQRFKQVLRHEPTHVATLNLLSILLTHLKRFAEAEPYIKKAMELTPNSDATLYNYGIILKSLNRPAEALERFTHALSINPNLAETWNNRGTILNELKRYDEAIADFNKAIALNQGYAEAYANSGKSLNLLERYEEASAAYDKALAINPDLVEAWIGRGGSCTELKHYDEALAAYDKALTIKPDLVEASLGRGDVLSHLKRYNEALAAYAKALFIKPDQEYAWLGRGNICTELRHYDEALTAYAKALSIKPDLENAWIGRGNALMYSQRHDEALAAYDRALSLKPGSPGVESLRFLCKMNVNDWSNFRDECEHLILGVKNNKANTNPFSLIAISASREDQLKCAKLWIDENYRASAKPLWIGEIYTHDRVRVGYVSADFRQHAISFLMAGMFECHEKTQFEITAISIGPDDGSELRNRVKNAFADFVDGRLLSDDEIAHRIRQKEIDILVDLNGFTQDARTGIFVRRPAPIQVNYLGYPGTMGARYIDYIIADRTLVPQSHQQDYSEKIVYLPHSYQVNDRKRAISEKPLSREDVGLPRDGFVFCCFNNSYKILPDVFDSWMRIVKKVEGSVLWLLETNETATRNLRKEVKARGIDPERLIFAKRLRAADHLARHRLADLFLDTRPYNAHTTASDALWAGLPVLTFLGETFAGRVAASLLNAIGLPDLITTTLEAYEQLAFDLATHPEKLLAIKRKLAENRDTTPLFDTKLFTKHIEAAYTMIYERYQNGLAPDHIIIPN